MFFYRQPGQNYAEELKSKDFKRELHAREIEAKEKSRKPSAASPLAIAAPKKPRLEALPSNIDADDKIFDDDADEDDEDDDDDDEDDAEELLAELNRIRKEREAEEFRREEERRKQEEKIRLENIIRGNPLINTTPTQANFKVKRRWDHDVVFKNCAKNDTDEKGKSFINDTLRSDFHKKFMEKYIK